MGTSSSPSSLHTHIHYSHHLQTAENAPKLSADLRKGFILMGLSSSGGTVAALTHRARDDPFFATRKITGQVLIDTVACHEDAYPEQ